VLAPLVVDPTLTIPAADLSFAAVRASGPGGQNVNKVASKVELRFDLEGTAALGPDVKQRLRSLAASRLDAEGWILVRSQKTRDQAQNLEDAREKLREIVASALRPPKVRRPTRKSRGSNERRLRDKKAQGAKKSARRTDTD